MVRVTQGTLSRCCKRRRRATRPGPIFRHEQSRMKIVGYRDGGEKDGQRTNESYDRQRRFHSAAPSLTNPKNPPPLSEASQRDQQPQEIKTEFHAVWLR